MGESWLGAMVAPLSAHETSDVTGSKAHASAATPGNIKEHIKELRFKNQRI